MSHPPATTATVPPVNPESWQRAVRTAWQHEGLRLTEPRKALLQAIIAYQTPFSAEQLYTDLSGKGAPGRATVYRTLEQLQAAGWLVRIHTATGEGYVPSFPGHVHHLVCTTCGAVIPFEGCALEHLLEQLATETDFVIEAHLLQLFGRCRKCQLAQRRASA